MLFPKDIEQKLGFDKIRELLKIECSGSLGVENIQKASFSSNKNLIRKWCAQTEEYKKMIEYGEKIPPLNYSDAYLLLDRINTEGTFLEGGDLLQINKTLVLFHSWSEFVKKKKDPYPLLAELLEGLFHDQSLITKIEEAINERGEVKDHASPELRKIRSEYHQSEIKARKSLDRILRSSRQDNISPEDSSLTIRNGRLVIPVKAEYKRSVKGFIHDESASGNIVFIEPAEVLEINNDIRDLLYRERREVVKVLTKLTDLIRPHIHDMSSSFRKLGILDYIKAKALFAIKINATTPGINDHKNIQWVNARHPILMNSLAKQEKEIVPLNIVFEPDKRIILISGPNAGGKSVCLQTVGLLQYMFQCGLLIPVDEGSVTGIFNDIFIDIGDEQSIEDDLSTYSSHLKSMNYFLNFSGKNTLFLIDEFGAGTDPQFGGAIAEAILEQLIRTKASGIITTHYGNLKKMAEHHQGLVNARMRFDVKNLNPLYQLEIGKPGSSFALEIAGKIGLNKQLLREARKKVGTDAVQLDRLLGELETEKKKYEEQSSTLEKNNELLKKSIDNYTALKEDIDERRKIILNEAKSEAKNLLKETNQKVENLIREIKEHNAEKESTRAAREELKSYEKTIRIEKETPVKETIKIVGGPINTGDQVRIKGQKSVGEVLKKGRQDAEVLFGDLKSKIKLNRLEKVSGPVKTKSKPTSKYQGIDINERKANFSSDLDIRGLRAEEAISKVNMFLDNAIMFGIRVARIIHGKGDGILREIVRNELNAYKEVSRYYDEHADRGGSGITVIEF